MTTASTGAVFFLGSRAHYQVLQPPEPLNLDAENGNTSTETIYTNSSVSDQLRDDNNDRKDWSYCDNDINISDDNNPIGVVGVKRRSVRRTSDSEAIIFDKESDMKPAILNHMMNGSPKTKSRGPRTTFASLLSSLRRRLGDGQSQPEYYLHHLETALAQCSYRESCRCLECQSRYFECDESEDLSSDDDDFKYPGSLFRHNDLEANVCNSPCDEEEDDEVFIDSAPTDATSTDLLISTAPPPEPVDPDSDSDMQLEMAAGTPLLLNYLLTHPLTCSIQ